MQARSAKPFTATERPCGATGGVLSRVAWCPVLEVLYVLLVLPRCHETAPVARLIVFSGTPSVAPQGRSVFRGRERFAASPLHALFSVLRGGVSRLWRDSVEIPRAARPTGAMEPVGFPRKTVFAVKLPRTLLLRIPPFCGLLAPTLYIGTSQSQIPPSQSPEKRLSKALFTPF